MEKNFNNLGISPAIIKAVEEMGFVAPTEVQSKVIPYISNLKDLIVMSKTGSGKTGAFGITMLQTIDTKADGPQALILTPTRELAVQVDSDIKLMSKHMDINTTAIYGQHNMNLEITALKKGVTIVTGTPGRVTDHIKKGNLVTKNIKYLVLDEADRMLDMGFVDQVIRIIKSLPKNRITFLFSATMPEEIQRICKEYMKQPETIEIESDTKTVDSIKQTYYRVEPNEKRTQLDRVLTIEQPDSCMVFCNTRFAVDKVSDFLTRKGYTSKALHGANTQSSRMRTIEQFKKGTFQVLVATDVAARGIHIDELSLVINYDVPVEKDSYVHRIGRTGRAGSGGRAITIVTGDEIMSLYEIEEHVGTLIEEAELPTDEFVKECKANASGKWVGVKPQINKPRAKEHIKAHKPKTKLKPLDKSKVEKKPEVQAKPKTTQTKKPATPNKTQRTKPKTDAKPAINSQLQRKSTDPKPLPMRTIEPKAKTTAQKPLETRTTESKPATTEKKSFFKQISKMLKGK